jgi:general secretion pathway protein I
VKQQGFSLLEAIVALILIVTVGMALLSWVNTNLITLDRVQHTYQRNEAIRNALVFMSIVNPLEKPKGKEQVGIYQLSWEAKAIELPKDGTSTLGYLSLYQISLYDTEVKVSLEEALLARFTLRQVGFKQVREPLDSL